jgi:hypothetical protein
MIVRGPFEVSWNNNTITDVEELGVDYSVDTSDYTTVGGKTIEVAGPHKVVVTMTLLGTDVESLAAVLPQYEVGDGGTLSTGEAVSGSGAIDVVPGGCGLATVYSDLDVTACGINPQVFRVVNARTEIDSVEIDSSKIRKVLVRFIGEAAEDEATVQFFAENDITPVVS